ncbi:MAG: XRE family transcriptional regulator [Roseburia intestinalis]|nr:XRE family transcriptional regulator [Roseburia intestinalis]
MNVKQAVARRIELLCKERGIAYNELANICGVTPSTIYSIFDDKRKNITLSTVKKICDGFEISLGEFFSHPLLLCEVLILKYHTVQIVPPGAIGGYHL